MFGIGKKPSVLGGTMIISGTAIGAGMLALPTISAGMWIWWSLGLMVVTWLMMLLSSQAILEVNLNYNPGASFHTLVYDNLGKFWNLVNGLSVAFVLYILLYAYVSGGGSMVAHTSVALFGYEPPKLLSGLLFAILLSACVWWSTYAVDRFSVVMIGGMVITFIFAMSGMLGEIKTSLLLDLQNDGSSYGIFVFAAVSTYLTSFCFHASVPSLVKYFGKDSISINKCLVYGTLIALLAYVIWIVACDGNIMRSDFKEVIAAGGNVSHLIEAASSNLNGNFLLRMLDAFAFLAVATSFLGAGLGLFDYMADLCGFDDSRVGRTKTMLVTFAPPIIAGMVYPDGFLLAIGWAGLAATIWSVVIPALLLRASRKRVANQEINYRVKGGNFTIYTLLIFGCVVGICHILFVFNVLPMYQ
ncbi:aromatic amino acid transport family protein [Helicobacter canadensis]|uniref:Tryptophan/tyrosine permease n=1 Tax=Helicobacter canadensis MIT 98-5491 TaxID=537970 RepID=C5ZXT2_9HELI|nr:aromatic amino acid transport family protein [Helicobacter canadensis]EES89950.1 putative tryptophan/tyrosine permease [Helicobacter canadensis MIT 98-5491]EFR49097.1 aromatic amino acid transport protein [Helicobacter canadensis MIT 98-5491]STP02551.1 Tryptophan permease [Helicobacter canadensis]